MKFIFIGLLTVFSLSSFATDCSLSLDGYQLSKKDLRILENKYQIVEGEARFKLDIRSQCMGDSCATNVIIRESNGDKFDSALGEETINFILLRGNVLPRLGDTSIRRALKKLTGCSI